MKKFKQLTALVLTVAIPLTLAACSSTKQASTTSTGAKHWNIQIQALGGGVCGAPAYIAKEKGFFAQNGIDVTLTSGTFETQKDGLASGKYVVANGDFQFFPSVQQGLDIKVIGGLHTGCIKLVVPPNSSIKTAADLKGKRIGVDEIGGTPMAITSVVLVNTGIDPQNGVTWKPFPLDQLVTEVNKGEIDAFAAWDPYGTLAVQNNGYKVLTDIATDPLFAGKTCCFLYASEKYIKSDPALIAAIVKSYQEADDWIQKNQAEAAQIEINKKYISTDDLNLVTSQLKSYSFVYTTDKAKNDVKYFVGQLDKTGFLNKGTDPTKFANNVYYDALKGAK
ncbi:MAG: ABC transporter substrate-binding protein [Ethanoligenens sp.]